MSVVKDYTRGMAELVTLKTTMEGMEERLALLEQFLATERRSCQELLDNLNWVSLTVTLTMVNNNTRFQVQGKQFEALKWLVESQSEAIHAVDWEADTEGTQR